MRNYSSVICQYSTTLHGTIPLVNHFVMKRLQRLQIQRCKRSGTKSPATGERRSERDRERYRAAVHHSIATESQGRYSLVRLRGERRPSKGGVTSRLKLLASSKPFTLTDALALVFHTYAGVACRVTRVTERKRWANEVRRSRDGGSVHVIEESFLPTDI